MSEVNPLLSFSLAGEGGALTARAIRQLPLLGDVCLMGEITVWYARPNTGKTLIALALITDAVNEKKIDPHDVFYINADDSQAGYAEKVKILDDFGVHSLVPGEKGFKLQNLVPALNQMAETKTAGGKLVVVDTVKKIADLMDKRLMRNFGIAIRPFTMGGGTLLLLAHTNKGRDKNGELIYAGTTDLIEDADSAYLIDKADQQTPAGKKLVRFINLKRRGQNADSVLYQYDDQSDLSYQERLLSVETADPVYGETMFLNQSSEEDIKLELALAIQELETPAKMFIVKHVSGRTKTSRRKVQAVLDRHTHDDPELGLWAYEVRARGAHLFRLHPAGTALIASSAK